MDHAGLDGGRRPGHLDRFGEPGQPVDAADEHVGDAARVERWLARAKCSSCRYSFTCYPDELYPRRQYQLDVVAHVVAEISLGGASAAGAAREVGASTTSARRWTLSARISRIMAAIR